MARVRERGWVWEREGKWVERKERKERGNEGEREREMGVS